MSTQEMSSRERLLAAYRHEPVDRIPCSPRIAVWLKEYYGNYELATHLRCGQEFGWDVHWVRDPFENAVGLGVQESYDLPEVKYAKEEYAEGEYRMVRRVFETPEGRLTDVTQFSPAGDLRYGMTPNPIHTEYLFKTKDDMKRLKYLVSSPERADWTDWFAAERMLGEDGLLMLQIRSAVNGRGGEALPTEELMMMFYDDRELFDEYLALFHEAELAEVKAGLRAGVKHFFLNWYYNSLSTGWSPSIWRDSFFPQLKAVCDLIHEGGGTANFYDDGRCMGAIDFFADAGIDVLQTLTPPPVGDVDLAEVKRRIGARVCLMGYVDLIYVLQRGTPELIEKTVKEAIETAGPTGFILGTSDSIRDGTPLENVKAYFAAARKYG